MALKIYFEDEFKMIDDSPAFFSRYARISAAGGVVINDEQKILLIFRRGKWDLPKGKAEEDESMETCAEREVKEETGLTEIFLQRFLLTTYHTYTEKGQNILKDTHWYLFTAPGAQDLVPQTEEDIMQIEWTDAAGLHKYMGNTFALIKDVLAQALPSYSE